MFKLAFFSIKEHYKEIINKLLPYFLIGLVLLCSGNGYILLYFDSKVRMVVYLILAAILLLLVIFKLKPFLILKKIKNKEFPIESIKLYVLYGIFMILVFAISFLANSNKSLNLYNYLDIIFIFIASMLFVSMYSIERFAHFFTKSIFIISIVSLFLYILIYVTRTDFSIGYFLSGTNRYDNYFFMSLFYNDKMYLSTDSPRMISIFWEPGVYGTFLLIAMIFEIKFKKTNYVCLLIYLICMLFTKSTASLILLIFVLGIFISTKFPKQKTIYFCCMYISILVVLLFGKTLSNVFPTIFGKFYSGSISFVSRLYSPYFYLETFISSAKTFFLGMGGVSANEYYNSIALSSGLIDSGTSTSTYLMAAYGIFGVTVSVLPIVGIFYTKNSITEKICIALLVLAILNKENHASVLCSAILLFYLIKCIPCSFKIKSKSNVDYTVDSDCNLTFREILFAKNNRGIFLRNICGTTLVKVISLFVSIITIPIYTWHFADSHLLDVWLVIYSVLSWMLLFDFGFGNGMKNKLIESISENDLDKAKKHISNTYFSTILISVAIFIISLVLCLTVDLNVVFGDKNHLISSTELTASLIIIALSVCMQFFLRNIMFVLQAKKHNVIGNSFSLISASSLLFLLCVFNRIESGKFVLIAFIYLFAMNVPLLIANVIFFSKNRKLIPTLKYFSFSGSKEVMSIGIKYFIVQLCNLVLWSTNTILITHLFDPASQYRFVYYYTCFYKVFSTIVTLLMVISSSVWVEAGEALATKNLQKIKKLNKLSFCYSGILIFIALIATFGMQFIFDIWLGTNSFEVQIADITIFALYCFVTIIAETIIIFANAFSKLKAQLIVSIVFAALKIPLLLLFINVFKVNFSWNIVVAYNVIYSLFLIIFVSLEIRKFVRTKFDYSSLKEKRETGKIKNTNNMITKFKNLIKFRPKKSTLKTFAFFSVVFLVTLINVSVGFSSILKDREYIAFTNLEKSYNDDSSKVLIQQFSTDMTDIDVDSWKQKSKTFDMRFSSPSYASIFLKTDDVVLSFENIFSSNPLSIADITHYDDIYYNLGKVQLQYSLSMDFSSLYDGASIYIPKRVASELLPAFGLGSDDYASICGKEISLTQGEYTEKYVIQGIFDETASLTKENMNKVYSSAFGNTCFVSRENIFNFKNLQGYVTFGTNSNKNIAIHEFLESRFLCDFKMVDCDINNAYLVKNSTFVNYYNFFSTQVETDSKLAIFFIVCTIPYLLIVGHSLKEFALEVAREIILLKKRKANKSISHFSISIIALSIVYFLIIYLISSKTSQYWMVFHNKSSIIAFILCVLLVLGFGSLSIWYQKEKLLIRDLINNNSTIVRDIIEEDKNIDFDFLNNCSCEMPELSKKAIVFSRGGDLSTAVGQRTIGDAILLNKLGYYVYICGISNYSDGERILPGIEIIKWDINLQKQTKFKKLIEFSKNDHIKKGLEIAKCVDAIVCNSVLSIGQVRYLKKYCESNKIRLVFDIVEFQNLSEQTFSSFWNYYIPNVITNRFLIKKNDRVVAISSYLENYFHKRGCLVSRIPFVNLSFDNSYFSSNAYKGRITFLYAGSPGKKDNLYGIIKAFANLDEETKTKVCLIIAGPNEHQLTKIGISTGLIEKCGDCLLLVGRIPFEQLISIYRSCDFSVLLKNNLMRHAKADYPSKVSQSLSFSLPVISNKSSDLVLYINDGENGFLLDKNDVNLLSSKIKTISAFSKEKIDNLKKNALESARKTLSIDSAVNDMEIVIK